MIRYVKSFFCLWEAWKRAGDGDWGGAHSSLEQFSDLVRKEVPSLQVPLEINILALQIAFFNNQAESALSAAFVCADQLVSSRNDDAKKYLAHFTHKITEACSKKFINYGKDFTNIAENIVLEPFDLRRVSTTIRHRAPL